MRRPFIVLSTLALIGRAESLFAGATYSAPTAPIVEALRPAGADLIPFEMTTYSSCGKACESALALAVETTRAGGAASAGARSSYLAAGEAGADETSRRNYLPVLLSLLVPGSGEIYMGYYVRGAVLLAAEVTAWTGYAYYHNKGLDSRAEYESFADAHWSYDRWVDEHALWLDDRWTSVDPTFAALDSIGRDYWDGWPPYHTWHSKEEEKQNYYENIGKYDWFISGWEDWDSTTQPRDTGLRTTYRTMRKKSNDELDTATNFIYLSVAARVISLVETIILTRRDDPGAPGETPSSNFSISTRATGLASGEVALVYRFR